MWLLWAAGLVCFGTVMATFNTTDPCNKALRSTFTSNLTTDVVIDCNNGTISWHVPMRYLETEFIPADLDLFEGHSVCIKSISNPDIEIIQNIDGILTWLKHPTSGNETCTSPVIGIITVALKGPNFPKTFAVFAPYRIVRRVSPDEVHYVHEKKEDI